MSTSCILKTSDHLLGNSSLNVHEGEKMVEMSVDSHDTTSDFSSVLNGGSVDASIPSPEKLNDPGSGEIMLVDRLIF